jgi:DNA primase small subunit
MDISGKEESSGGGGVSGGNNKQDFSIDFLRLYYNRLFPYEQMYNWLSYGNDPKSNREGVDKTYFLNREWSFTIEDEDKSEIYIRYQCFRDMEEMRHEIIKRCPHKIDIGAVFSAPPKDHNTIQADKFKPEERELVFDIDMTDYDSIRICPCKGAVICNRCWPFMTMSLKVVDAILREDFGFKHLLWIYSGRRGIHCWVGDSEGRKLSNDARAGIIEYMSIKNLDNEDNSDSTGSAFVQPFHPLLKRAYEILEPLFERYIVSDAGQGILNTKNQSTALINTIPNEQIRLQLFQEWESKPKITGSQKWQMIKDITSAGSSGGNNPPNKKVKVNYAELEVWRYKLIFKYGYPRLDVNVSKAQNHLLKSPFCIHPKTGRLCTPIDPSDADSFDPFAVPTVRMLCEEINAYDAHHGASAKGASDVTDIEKTSMKDSIAIFNKTFMNGLNNSIRRHFQDEALKVQARDIDF